MNAKEIFISKESVDISKKLESIEDSDECIEEGKLEKLSICHVNEKCNDNSIYGSNLISDIEVFKTFTLDECDNTLLKHVVQHCVTCGSKSYIKYLLHSPLKDCNLLNKRQETIKSLKHISTEDLIILNNIQVHEKHFLWLFNKNEQTIDDIYNMVYFKSFITSFLNKNEYALTGLNVYNILISPSIGLLSPILYFVMPYMVIIYKFKIKISFKTYMKLTFKTMFMSTSSIFGSSGGFIDNFKYVSFGFSLLFYFQSLFNGLHVSSTMYKISSLLTEKINGFLNFISDCKYIRDKYWIDEISPHVFNCSINIKKDIELFQDISTEKFKLFSNFGSRLKIFKDIKKEDYIPLVQQVYMIDAIRSIQSLECVNKYTYTTFIEGSSPECHMIKIKHPCLDKNIVENDVHLGGKDARNVIITGPNAGGKSTLIKSLLSNVFLSQTLTICASKKASMTPFSLIHSQINIPDCKGKESLFEAEMHRSKESIEMIEKCNGLSLVVMDEIFNSTNPVEGISGAYAIAKKIGSNKDTLMIVCTHYLYLTNLSSEFDYFTNYKMSAKVKEDRIEFPYKLKKGICKQFIALELLKKNGFDKSIIDDAIEIKKLFT